MLDSEDVQAGVAISFHFSVVIGGRFIDVLCAEVVPDLSVKLDSSILLLFRGGYRQGGQLFYGGLSSRLLL